jgi:hypothetical protein
VVGVDDQRVSGVAAGINDQGGLLVQAAGGMRVIGRGTVLEIDGKGIRREERGRGSARVSPVTRRQRKNAPGGRSSEVN